MRYMVAQPLWKRVSLQNTSPALLFSGKILFSLNRFHFKKDEHTHR